MASAEQKGKWRQASQRYRDKKLALDPEACWKKERVRVAATRERQGPPTEEQRLERNEAARLGMQEIQARRVQPPAHVPRGHGHATRANISTLMNT